ncbi:hypothetical protein N752_16610 [Desulforamulus aquiferis]|nr:ATP:cob(I)alamin adenosyltransferase [Desulforamulus aquiferis]RYD04011.1 hypothetical protein N752_16610 [Desulforamulus aquiferis]
MKVYTKTGDQGQTSLLSKQRVYKDDDRVHAYGTVDEASSAMGLAKSLTQKEWVVNIIHPIQVELISLAADLATEGTEDAGKYRISESHVQTLRA